MIPLVFSASSGKAKDFLEKHFLVKVFQDKGKLLRKFPCLRASTQMGNHLYLRTLSMRTVRTVELEKEEFISFFTMGRNVFVLHSHCVMQTHCLAFLTSGHQNPLPAGQIQLHTLSAKQRTSIYTTLLLVEYDIVNLSQYHQ